MTFLHIVCTNTESIHRVVAERKDQDSIKEDHAECRMPGACRSSVEHIQFDCLQRDLLFRTSTAPSNPQ